MKIKTSQLKPGYILLDDIKGKSGRPIILKDTVITEEHIAVMKKFLINQVEVSFEKITDENSISSEKNKIEKAELQQSSFIDHYLEVVLDYQKLFNKWQNNFPIDMPALRKILIPLFERIPDIESEVYMLHQYTTKKDYLYHHSIAVGILSAYIAIEMDYDRKDWIQIGIAGVLSDCGMAKIDQAILDKVVLSSREQLEIKRHPEHSYRLVEQIPTITKVVKLAISQHHERLDASGYPLELTRDRIHTYARIIAVSDMYHAMTCDRLHVKKQTPFSVMKELHKEKFTKYDTKVVQVFTKGFVKAFIGKKVRLSNDKIASIVFIDEKTPFLPMVQLNNEAIFNLEEEKGVFIKALI